MVFFLAQNDARGKLFGESLGLISNFAECYFPSYISFCCYDTSQMWLSSSAFFPTLRPMEQLSLERRGGGMEKYSATHPDRGQPDIAALLN